MILVSFFSAENALVNDVKEYTLDRRVLEIRRSPFWGDTRYNQCSFLLLLDNGDINGSILTKH